MDVDDFVAHQFEGLENSVLDRHTLMHTLRMLRQIPLLTAQEEHAYALQIEAARTAQEAAEGNQRPADPAVLHAGEVARQRLVESNLRLVIQQARRYEHSYRLPLMDLIQEGTIGLIISVDKYDWRRGYRFSTYAMHWIRQALSRAVANDSRVVRLPTYLDTLVSKVQTQQQHLRHQLQRDPTLEELSEALAQPVEKVKAVLTGSLDPLSLDLSVALLESEASPLGEQIEGMNEQDLVGPLLYQERAQQVQKALKVLTPQERTVITRLYGLSGMPTCTDAQLAREMKLSRARIGQIHRRALRQLRECCPDLKDLFQE